MESRKMVLMNLFAGRNGDGDTEKEETCEHTGARRGWGRLRE